MRDKNLFIGICTKRERTISPNNLKKTFFRKDVLKAASQDFKLKTSDWILQEIGFAVGKQIDIMLLLEEGVRRPGGLQGDLEYISFSRGEPEKSFNKILEMLKSLMPKQIPVEMAEVRQLARTDTAKETEPKDEGWEEKEHEAWKFSK